MLYSLMDGHARTSTELAIIGRVSPSTASVHLHRLTSEGLVRPLVQGRHRYYSLNGSNVARTLEGLSVLAGVHRTNFVPNTPGELRFARTCYDHMAGTAAVLVHDRFREEGWLAEEPSGAKRAYELTADGTRIIESLGIDVDATRSLRRRFAYGCIDWSERQPHIGGAIGSALLDAVLKRRWATRDLDSRALEITPTGRREFLRRFGVRL
jgi:hypothetical protein